MNERYPIPAGRHRVEEEILRSRFITTVGHAPTVDEARAFIATVGEEFADASHNCWAYVVGSPGSTAQIGMSDAGEPHGTLLGKGGLVKAYSGGVQLALESLPRVEKVSKAVLAVMLDYSSITPFQRMLPEFEGRILDEQYAVDVTFRLELPVEHVARFQAAVAELTAGEAVVELLSSPSE